MRTSPTCVSAGTLPAGGCELPLRCDGAVYVLATSSPSSDWLRSSCVPAYFALKRTTDAPGQDTLLEFVAVVNGEG
jgi:hypothetical protein